jgi:hypothetical protein
VIKGVTVSPGGSGMLGAGITTGVKGQTLTGTGVSGESNSGYGVKGESLSGMGVYGSSDSGTGVYGFTDTGQFAIHALNHRSGGFGVFAEATDGSSACGIVGHSGTGTGVYGSSGYGPGTGVYAKTVNGTALYCDGKFYQTGGVFEAHPTSTTWSTNKPATVKRADGSTVKLFAEEATEVYFSDYGSSRLVEGRAHVELDPVFLETVTIGPASPMRVFVQLEGEANGVFVTDKTDTSFDVVELAGGRSNAEFSYRVVCTRRYYEGERLATQADDEAYNRRVLDQVWPEVLQPSHVAGQSIATGEPK